MCTSQTGYKNLEELLRRKEHLILKQAQEILELKQKLLLTQNLLNEAKQRLKKTYGESHVALSSIVSLVMLIFCATRFRRHHSFEQNRIEVQE